MESKKSNSSKQLISDVVYNQLKKRISKIAMEMVSSTNKAQGERPIIENLLDIERQIDRYLTYYRIVLSAEKKANGLVDEKLKNDAVTNAAIKNLNSKKLSKDIRNDHN